MSEFAAIIGVLVEVVAFIFNRIIDVVCLGCLLASLVFPWRWIEACDSGEENRISNNWREYCLTMFGITIFDFIVIPFTLCTFLSPLRWKSICLECGTKHLPNNMDIRCMLVYQGFFAILDVVRFAIGLITLASPIGRQIPVVRASCTVLSHIFYGEPEQINITSSYCDKKINDLFMLLLFNGITTIRDIFCVICLFLGILVPTTWKAIFNGIGLICRNYQYNYTRHDCSWDDMYTRLCILFIFQPIHALIDLICAPFAFSVIISPFRCGRFFTHIKALQDEQQELNRDTSADYACGFEYHWSEKNRAYAIRTGCLCFSDVLMIPFLLPLWISCYRFSPIKESMNKDTWGFDELGLVFEQFSYFLSDLIIIVPLLPILFLTRIRYKPVQALFDRAREENKSVVFDYNRDLYVLLIAQFGKLLFDILVLPFTLFVLIFFYRSRSVVAIFKNEHIWEKGVTFHCNVLFEFFVVLHDVCLMVPLSFVLLAIAPWRFVFLFKTKFRHLTCFYSLPIGFDGIDDSAAVALAQSDVETTSPNAPVPSVVDEIYSDDYSILEWRYEVWRQLIAAFVDFPFFALGLVVMFTLWRSCELYYHIHAAFVVKQRWRYGSGYNWRIRGAICNQFKDLLLDILCLIPFSFIVGTLYKLPKLILDLYGKTLGPPLQSASFFDTKELKLYLPETGGPSLLFFLRSSDSLKDKNSLAFDPSKPLKLQIVSSALWSSVEHAFGSSLASIGRSMFPMTLTSNNQESNYFSFSEIADGNDHMVINVVAKDKDNAALLPSTSTSENDKKSSGCSHLVTLKLGKFKRSTMMKKLDLLSRQGVTMVNIQLESVNNQGANVVLCRCGFDMKELFSSLSATESVTQAEIPIEKDNNNFFISIAASDNRSNNFVNSFSLVVSKIFVEIMIDLVYLFMFFGSILNPYRFFVLVKSLLESASLLPYRLSVTCLKLMKHADAHLLAYRNEITPALMTDIKNNYDNINSLYYYDDSNNGYNYGNVYSYRNNISYHEYNKSFKEAENLYLQQYTKLYIEFEKALNFDGCEKFLALVKERYDFQDKLMDLWFKRMAANTLIVQSAFESPNVNVGLNAQYKDTYSPIDKDRANLAYWILDEEMISFSKKIAENKSNLEKEIEVLKANANAKANKKNCGIFNQSSASNH